MAFSHSLFHYIFFHFSFVYALFMAGVFLVRQRESYDLAEKLVEKRKVMRIYDTHMAK